MVAAIKGLLGGIGHILITVVLVFPCVTALEWLAVAYLGRV